MEIIDTHSHLNDPRFQFDYAGEFDHALVELSDILPEDLYM